MSNYTVEDQLNAMTSLVASLLQSLHQSGALSGSEIKEVVQRAADNCGRRPETSGASEYLRETYLSAMR